MSNPSKPRLLCGFGEINFGKQYRQGNRVYDSREVAMALNSQPVGNIGGYSYLYLVGDNLMDKRIRESKCQEGVFFIDKEYSAFLIAEQENTTEFVETDPYRIRKLTPLECFRLMGFSDEDFLAAKVGDKNKAKELLEEYEPEKHLEMMRFVNTKDMQNVSNSQLYKQAGNSIVVDVLYHIYKEIYNAMPYLFDDLQVGSYFSGIGAFEKALDRLYENDIKED